jgi:hypothetical protein
MTQLMATYWLNLFSFCLVINFNAVTFKLRQLEFYTSNQFSGQMSRSVRPKLVIKLKFMGLGKSTFICRCTMMSSTHYTQFWVKDIDKTENWSLYQRVIRFYSGFTLLSNTEKSGVCCPGTYLVIVL